MQEINVDSKHLIPNGVKVKQTQAITLIGNNAQGTKNVEKIQVKAYPLRKKNYVRIDKIHKDGLWQLRVCDVC